ncbi:hypothetical protein BWI96_10390 [Siphonobacter sp. SORGH_AS_0500]|uniref:hypothetical protein n=1 Tax=Siphonobacter sp. SORGH_AS_0500 TaxID=1864824 RepID=UPI000CBB4536|nr:hypothetical protein [Siphonobacter sp. SORGH_AS_0500]PKK36770.1 hypothetical protein BWI96_10390 [Siphonobacter sp. SORGH_AS_0500]
MKNIFSILALIAIIIVPLKVQAQIDINKLYGKHWRTKTYDIVKSHSTIPIYYRYEDKGALDYGSTTTFFHNDGKITGFNAGGWPAPGSYKLLPNNQIFIEGDEKASQITKLTDTEFSIEITQPYTTTLTNETYNITTKITYESFDPCTLYESLRSGNWDDPTLWTCQQVPSVNTNVQINKNHKIKVPSGYTAYAKNIILKGELDLQQNANLISSNK